MSELHDIIQKWVGRGYIIDEVAADIETDIVGALRQNPNYSVPDAMEIVLEIEARERVRRV